MKKTTILLTIAVVVGIASYVVFAQEQQRGGMMGRGMMGRQGMMGMSPMASMMYSTSLAATNDGGVVVLMGNKLTRYDNDLNAVKEVEVKIDWENWNKMMQQHYDMMMKNQNMMMGGQSD